MGQLHKVATGAYASMFGDKGAYATIDKFGKERYQFHVYSRFPLQESVQAGNHSCFHIKFGERFSGWLEERRTRARVVKIAIPDTFVEQGGTEALKEKLGLSAEGILERVLRAWEENGPGETADGEG